MQTVLSITIPFFAIIFLGTFFKAIKYFDDNSSKILTRFALFVTLPPFIFINIIKSSNKTIFQWEFIIRFELVTIIILICSFLLSKFFFSLKSNNSSLFSLNSAYPNYGYMGIPLCILAFGENASIPISIILLIDSIVLFSFTSFFISNFESKNFFSYFFSFIISMLKNPILVSVFIGFIFIFFKLPINLLIYKSLEVLSYAAPPTALFALGITLWNKLEGSNIVIISVISVIKLIIHPILIFAIFYLFPSSVPIMWIKVAILCSCLPVAANVFAMAGLYNTFIKETSNSIMITTILSTFSIPIILFFLL